jgi:4a-hydroxytetrahydrobiopterin dehydratase
MKILKFNESNQNPINSIEEEILDLLQDGFLDNGIPVEIKFDDVYINSTFVKNSIIASRQSIILNIGNPERSRKKSEYFTLKDKFDDLKRLTNWLKKENIHLKEFGIYGIFDIENDLRTDNRFLFHNMDAYDSNENLFFKKSTEEYGFVQLVFKNHGWQTNNNEILQEYKFKDMNQVTKFIFKCVKIFDDMNHHPNYLNWVGNKLTISLQTHSTNSVTEKDWELANKLDTLID